MVKGGRESKCISKGWEESIGKPLGMVCPRVDLWPELVADAEILEFSMSERLRPMSGLRAELVAMSHGLTPTELNDSLSRVAYVLADSAVRSYIDPKVS